MKIIKLDNLDKRTKSQLFSMVDVHKSQDLFGDCDGISLRIVQNPRHSDEVTFIYMLFSPDEAWKLVVAMSRCANQADEWSRKRQLTYTAANNDPFPGL